VPIATPWGSGIRLAVLRPWFRVGSGARVFMELSAGALRRFGPGAIAGPVPALKELARAVVDGAAPLGPLEFGVLAFTGPSQAPLTAADRELFWRAFQAPVFEQYRGPHGELLAYECEAHEGLHLVRESVIAELRGYALAEQACPCGAVTARAAPALARAAAG
jgi:phenylacetate-coenzyme A ligase PaaK-like adenylate-forming protein